VLSTAVVVGGDARSSPPHADPRIAIDVKRTSWLRLTRASGEDCGEAAKPSVTVRDIVANATPAPGRAELCDVVIPNLVVSSGEGTVGPVGVRLTVYPGADHDAWSQTYDLSVGHDVYTWLLGHKRQ
jgi:hypothetical protein